MPSSTVHLLRHGEVYNPAGVLYGRLPDFHLSELGRQMADCLAEHFARRAHDGARIVLLAASPLIRAQETAAPTAAALGLEVGTEPRIIEAENHFEGLKVTPRELLKPKHWPYILNPLRPSWGEPYEAQAARVLAAARDAARTAYERGGEGSEAILVAHQLPIWAARLKAEGRPLAHDPRKRECTLTSLTSLTIDTSTGSVVSLRYTEPAARLLPGAATTPGA
ncbi:histidine phosphatase family protein [Sinomonas sp. ASV486]|uniref:Histidine phosphatase family protein n=1 Tax=Sinomonas puerhi TaxID=3238584 RepID=A0AB39L0T7_9MICC|nr:histidine phosphatase family protein [Sinomonas sp. ASV486]MDQ4492041.1 histidine phosphatase family protein [Sinomonas sp. ASV486]